MKSRIKKYLRDFWGYTALEQKLDYNIKLNNENLWAQIFNNTIFSSKWLIKKEFSPGRWAVGYPMLYIMYRILNDVKPLSILEFGLGESSKMTYQYKVYNNDSDLCIIEQDKNWLEYFSRETFDVNEFVKLLPLEKVYIKDKLVHVYSDLLSTVANHKFDFIIIDGPWGSPEYSRPQIIDIVKNDLLSEKFVILMDDYNRVGEQQTISEVCQLFNEKNIQYKQGIYSGLKAVTILCSPEYSFLTSL